MSVLDMFSERRREEVVRDAAKCPDLPDGMTLTEYFMLLEQARQRCVDHGCRPDQHLSLCPNGLVEQVVDREKDLVRQITCLLQENRDLKNLNAEKDAVISSLKADLVKRPAPHEAEKLTSARDLAMQNALALERDFRARTDEYNRLVDHANEETASKERWQARYSRLLGALLVTWAFVGMVLFTWWCGGLS